MKRIINCILLVGSIVSIGIALKYSALPIPNFLPESFVEFWNSSVEEREKYVLLYDIAIGFLMSVLFYFVVDEIPDIVRLYKAKKLIKSYINQTVEYMEQTISIICSKYNRNLNISELAQKDFLILDGETKIPFEEISYLTTTYYLKNKKRKTAVHQYGTINDLVKSNLKKIIKNISIIKDYEYFYSSDVKLVECIRKIERCKLIRFYLKTDESSKDTPCFQLHGTSTAMSDFVRLYMELLHCKFHTEYTITNLDSEEETKKYHDKRESGEYIYHAFELQNEKKRKAIDNLTAVVSGTKYTTDILVSRLKGNFIASYYSIDDLRIENLNAFKHIVFIVDSETKPTIISLLNKNEILPNILLLTEQHILKNKIAHKINSKNIVGEINFKVSFKMCPIPIVFNKEEPSEETIVNIISDIENSLYK